MNWVITTACKSFFWLKPRTNKVCKVLVRLQIACKDTQHFTKPTWGKGQHEYPSADLQHVCPSSHWCSPSGQITDSTLNRVLSEIIISSHNMKYKHWYIRGEGSVTVEKNVYHILIKVVIQSLKELFLCISLILNLTTTFMTKCTTYYASINDIPNSKPLCITIEMTPVFTLCMSLKYWGLSPDSFASHNKWHYTLVIGPTPLEI
jgi:hypothetical protein